MLRFSKKITLALVLTLILTALFVSNVSAACDHNWVYYGPHKESISSERHIVDYYASEDNRYCNYTGVNIYQAEICSFCSQQRTLHKHYHVHYRGDCPDRLKAIENGMTNSSGGGITNLTWTYSSGLTAYNSSSGRVCTDGIWCRY